VTVQGSLIHQHELERVVIDAVGGGMRRGVSLGVRAGWPPWQTAWELHQRHWKNSGSSLMRGGAAFASLIRSAFAISCSAAAAS